MHTVLLLERIRTNLLARLIGLAQVSIQNLTFALCATVHYLLCLAYGLFILSYLCHDLLLLTECYVRESVAHNMVFVAARHLQTFYVLHHIVEELLLTQHLISKSRQIAVSGHPKHKHICIASAITICQPQLAKIWTDIGQQDVVLLRTVPRCARP